MVDVIDDVLDRKPHLFRFRFAALPARNHHPSIENSADDCAACDEGLDLIVRELAVVIDKSPTIVMARPNWSAEMIKRFPKAVIAEVRCIEDDSEAIHLLE